MGEGGVVVVGEMEEVGERGVGSGWEMKRRGAGNESLNTGFNLRPYTKVMGIGLTTVSGEGRTRDSSKMNRSCLRWSC